MMRPSPVTRVLCEYEVSLAGMMGPLADTRALRLEMIGPSANMRLCCCERPSADEITAGIWGPTQGAHIPTTIDAVRRTLIPFWGLSAYGKP